MNTAQEQFVEMSHRLASITLVPFRLNCHEVPIRLVSSRAVIPKRVEDPSSPNSKKVFVNKYEVRVDGEMEWSCSREVWD